MHTFSGHFKSRILCDCAQYLKWTGNFTHIVLTQRFNKQNYVWLFVPETLQHTCNINFCSWCYFRSVHCIFGITQFECSFSHHPNGGNYTIYKFLLSCLDWRRFKIWQNFHQNSTDDLFLDPLVKYAFQSDWLAAPGCMWCAFIKFEMSTIKISMDWRGRQTGQMKNNLYFWIMSDDEMIFNRVYFINLHICTRYWVDYFKLKKEEPPEPFGI